MDEDRLAKILEDNKRLDQLMETRGAQLSKLESRYSRSRLWIWALTAAVVAGALFTSWLTTVTIRVEHNSSSLVRVEDFAQAVDQLQRKN